MPPLMGWTSAADEITLGAWIAFCDAFSVAVSAFSGDRVDVSGPIRESRNFDAAGRRDGRKNHRAANRDFYGFAVSGEPRAVFFRVAGLIYLIGAVILGIWFLWASIQAARAKTVEKSRKLLLVSVLYLPIFFALMVFNH